MQEDLAHYSLLDALTGRRSRRFGRGFHLDGGPLSYRSVLPPHPLTLAEEAALAFAACGITGFTLGELPFNSGSLPESGGGTILAQFVGRAVASADAIHTVIVFVINDDGVWMIRRPQDLPRTELAAVVQMARDRRLTEQYERLRTRIAGRRLDVPREIPFVPAFNKWSVNLPGSTYFMPVNELTAIYINVLLTAFNEEFGYFVVDERRAYRPAGLARFAKSRGGHLHDDPSAGRLATVGVLDAWMLEFTALEQGGILQSLGLMAQALGLGGFPHFAAHPFAWFQTLGFRMEHPRFSRVFGLGPGMRALVKALRRDAPVPTAVGLERDGEVLIKPFCPPYYRNMEDAVLAFIDYKYAEGTGTLRDGGIASGWRDGSSVQAGMPRYSDRTIAAAIAYCDYLYTRYGRFPAISGPFRTVLAYQAHRLDLAFYNQFYRPDVAAEAEGGRQRR